MRNSLHFLNNFKDSNPNLFIIEIKNNELFLTEIS